MHPHSQLRDLVGNRSTWGTVVASGFQSRGTVTIHLLTYAVAGMRYLVTINGNPARDEDGLPVYFATLEAAAAFACL